MFGSYCVFMCFNILTADAEALNCGFFWLSWGPYKTGSSSNLFFNSNHRHKGCPNYKIRELFGSGPSWGLVLSFPSCVKGYISSSFSIKTGKRCTSCGVYLVISIHITRKCRWGRVNVPRDCIFQLNNIFKKKTGLPYFRHECPLLATDNQRTVRISEWAMLACSTKKILMYNRNSRTCFSSLHSYFLYKADL